MASPRTRPEPASIPPQMLALMVKGVSVIVSAAGLDLHPSLMRAMGSAVAPDGSCITVYLSRSQSVQLLQDISSTRRLAVVFSQPHSHRSVQLKGTLLEIRPADLSDQQALEHYLASMVQELSLIGYGPEFARAMFGCAIDDLVAVRFTPLQAFDQTPGPHAGTALSGTRNTAT